MLISGLRSLFDKAVPVKVSMTSTYDSRWQEFMLTVNKSSWIPEEESLTDKSEFHMRKFLVDVWKDPVHRSFVDFQDLLNYVADRCMMNICEKATDLMPKKERSKRAKAMYDDHVKMTRRLHVFASVLERRGVPQETYEMILRIGTTESIDINVIRLIDLELTKHLGTI